MYSADSEASKASLQHQLPCAFDFGLGQTRRNPINQCAAGLKRQGVGDGKHLVVSAKNIERGNPLLRDPDRKKWVKGLGTVE